MSKQPSLIENLVNSGLAKRTTLPEAPNVYKRFQLDAARCGVPARLFISDLPEAPEAMAVGHDVLISRTMLRILHEDQLSAVLGHELGHVRYNVIREQHAARKTEWDKKQDAGYAMPIGAGLGLLAVLALEAVNHDKAPGDFRDRMSRRGFLKTTAGAAYGAASASGFYIDSVMGLEPPGEKPELSTGAQEDLADDISAKLRGKKALISALEEIENWYRQNPDAGDKLRDWHRQCGIDRLEGYRELNDRINRLHDGRSR
jgi:Peptidase family M48